MPVMTDRKGRVKPERRSREDVTRSLSDELRLVASEIEDMTDQLVLKRKKRDRLIVKLADRDLSEREIGRMANMSGPRVNQIYHGSNGSK